MHLLNKPVLLFTFILWFLLPAGSNIASENTDRTLSRQQWQQLTSDTSFNYKDRKEATEKKQTQVKENAFFKAIQSILDFFGTTFGQLLFWGVLLAFFAYVAYKMFVNENFFLFKKEKKKQQQTGNIAEEEDITTTDWEEKMHQAIKANDIRYAVRYSYMWFLQLLQKKELIIYRNDKTNYDYYSELTETSYKQPFKQLSRQYEYAWYGHFALPESAFNDYMQLFTNVKKQLQ